MCIFKTISFTYTVEPLTRLSSAYQIGIFPQLRDHPVKTHSKSMPFNGVWADDSSVGIGGVQFSAKFVPLQEGKSSINAYPLHTQILGFLPRHTTFALYLSQPLGSSDKSFKIPYISNRTQLDRELMKGAPVDKRAPNLGSAVVFEFRLDKVYALFRSNKKSFYLERLVSAYITGYHFGRLSHLHMMGLVDNSHNSHLYTTCHQCPPLAGGHLMTDSEKALYPEVAGTANMFNTSGQGTTVTYRRLNGFDLGGLDKEFS